MRIALALEPPTVDIRFVTQDERHHGRENDVLANRVRVYERARGDALSRATS